MDTVTNGGPDAVDYAELLAPMFAEVLVLDEIDHDDSFFDLDGDSLAAVRLVTMISSELGVTVPIGEFFSHPTVNGVVEKIRASRPGGPGDSPRDVARPDPVPLSYAQEGIWFTGALTGWSGLYNLPVVVRLEHEVDVDALEAAIRDLVLRHEVLRTRFPEHDGTGHQQVDEPEGAFSGIRTLTGGAGDPAERLVALFREDFDVTGEAPLRTYLVRAENRPEHLVLLLHHMACDGVSMVHLVRELDLAYGARVRGTAPVWPGEVTQYADYAVWQRRSLSVRHGGTSRLDAATAFWRERLRGAPGLLTIPAARPRPEVPSSAGSFEPLAMPADVHSAALALARAENATLFMVLQTAFAVTLSDAGAGADIVLGTPVSGRIHPDIEDAVGLFVNLVALRTDLSGNPTFRELLVRVRASDIAAFNHLDVPFQKVVEAVAPQRRTNVHPLVQVTLTLDGDQVGQVPLTEIGGQAELPPIRVAKFDLSLILESRRRADGSPDGLVGRLEYSTDLFDAAVARDLCGRLAERLARHLGDPDARCGTTADHTDTGGYVAVPSRPLSSR